MPKTLWPFALAAALAVSPALAQQQRSANTGSATINRTWPWSGRWDVAMVKHRDSSELQCQFYTGYRDPDTHEDYFWGWRDYKGTLGFFIYDQASRPLSGADISVYIDDVKVLVLPITKRSTLDTFNNVFAPVADDKKAAVIDLLKSGGFIKLVTETSNYAQSLGGVKKAMEFYDECRGQADRLNALQKPPG